MQRAVDELWMFTGELFAMDSVDNSMLSAGIGVDLSAVKTAWDAQVTEVFSEATLQRPGRRMDAEWRQTGTTQRASGLYPRGIAVPATRLPERHCLVATHGYKGNSVRPHRETRVVGIGRRMRPGDPRIDRTRFGYRPSRGRYR